MREGPSLRDAVDNLEFTYLQIGSRCEGARVKREAGWVECTSKLAHAAGNFVLIKEAERETIQLLERRHRSRNPCSFYVLPGPGQPAALDLMRRTWRREGDPLLLMANGRPSEVAPVKLRQAADFERRLEVTRFMTRQFFSRTSSAVRDAVALATARAEVELVEVGERSIEAAAMVSISESAVGIYNVCVEASLRGRGIAVGMMEAILRENEGRRPTVALQCEARLVDWYRKWAFDVVGEIHMFA